MTIHHISKFKYQEGTMLDRPVMWCGEKWSGFDVYFTDIQHYAISNERRNTWGFPVCQGCLKAAMKAMEQEK